MSRMDKYKKIHEESQKEEKKPFNFRRELKKDPQTTNRPEYEKSRYEEQARFQEPQNNYYEDHYQEQSPEPKKKHFTFKRPKIKNPFKRAPKNPYGQKLKKKRSWRKILLFVLIALLGYSVVAFGVGNFAAKHDSSMAKIETQEFNGVASENGTKNILLLGSDTRDNISGRSDSMMVLQVDGHGKPKLVSFMRDMYVDIPGVGQNKLNAAYAYGGADLVRQTLKNNFGIDCRYYAMVDFQTFEKGIDTLFPSGVQLDAEKDMSAYIDEPITKGPQRMNGHTLLNYARFRMDEEGDFGRVRRQQQVMQTVFGQLKNPLVLLRGPYAAGKIWGYLSTDMPNTFLVGNLFNFAKAIGGIERLTLPVDGSWTYIDTANAGSALAVDTNQNAQAAQEFLGE
ncbi:LCP family protein [Enterococcus xiangfangensis]|uniref:Regulatory protein MsrR n=1 Tax=Enterococcus xiangfangensis TaxID=1296537 RepID=A0ABU3FC39_9ENTE|nr:LCP family protein [Enterococcus xiangfangensis]MDT2760245.1 LCP family protein [Enterococcus xiangfangensis]NBK07490.1 LytR family transcriptional regulator [Enterococcus asini]